MESNIQPSGLSNVVEDTTPQLGGDLEALDKEVSRPKLLDYSETVNALGDLAGGTDDIDLELGNVVTATVSTSAQTFTFSNPPANGISGSFKLILTNGGSQIVNWPPSVRWVGGIAPSLTASGVDVITFMTTDGGNSWYGLASSIGMVDGKFLFQIVTTSSPQTFTLPLGGSGAYEQDFTIDWGDTNSSIITSYDDPDKAHEYATAGTYDCVITGLCEYFGFNDGGDKTLLKRLDGIAGNIGFKVANFSGCSNLNYIDSTMNMWFRVTSFYYCFHKCSGLTSIPANLFDKNLAATDLRNCFYLCTGLTAIPANLFDKNTAVTNFRMCFAGCTGLTSIPANLFDKNIAAEDFYECFSGCTGLTALPDDLILYNVAIYNCGYMLFNCSGIVAGDGTAFVDRAVANGVSIFNNCFTGAINIPDYALIPAAWGGGGA